ncbi:MAG TPA: helix-turn-helix transcriptional regulator [Tissierellaceae bacterium]|nr:MAG: XRE family transcriptional regulator [Caldicoprobacter oshimai]
MRINEEELKNKYINRKYAVNEVIILLAKHLNLTQKDLVEATGIDKSKMSRFFNKKEIPNKEHLEKLSIPLKISKETLWIISGDMLPPNDESKIIDELKSLEEILTRLDKNEIKEELNIDVKLTASEKQFIQEYIEFIKYKRNKSAKS